MATVATLTDGSVSAGEAGTVVGVGGRCPRWKGRETAGGSREGNGGSRACGVEREREDLNLVISFNQAWMKASSVRSRSFRGSQLKVTIVYPGTGFLDLKGRQVGQSQRVCPPTIQDGGKGRWCTKRVVDEGVQGLPDIWHEEVRSRETVRRRTEQGRDDIAVDTFVLCICR